MFTVMVRRATWLHVQGRLPWRLTRLYSDPQWRVWRFLAVLSFAIANYIAGFFIFLYIVLPIFYWSNTYDAQKFPFYTSQTYNITRILNEKDFDINLDVYNGYSKLYLSLMFAFLYGLSFSSFIFATISYVTLYDGTFIWGMWKKATTATKDKFGDVHSRLMKKNHPAVPLTISEVSSNF